jgi:UDP-N-acetylglucosamine 1-carboxyvinyltransferase
MDKLAITGGVPLQGEVRVSGAKNAALPILCAALLTSEPLVLTNVPKLNDVRTMRSLLAQMGVHAEGGRQCADALGRRYRLAARALRDGEDDARVDPGTRTAARALRRSARVAAGRLRDRAAAGRPAHQRPAGDGAEIDLDHGYIDAKAKHLSGTNFVLTCDGDRPPKT